MDLTKILQADREIITNLTKSNYSQLFKVEDIPPELDDHIRHLLDETDIIRSLLLEVTNMYYNSDSALLNETMKRFTFLTSLFLLPSLIAAIFGMNNITGNITSFFVVIAFMFLSVIGLLAYFKHREYI